MFARVPTTILTLSPKRGYTSACRHPSTALFLQSAPRTVFPSLPLLRQRSSFHPQTRTLYLARRTLSISIPLIWQPSKSRQDPPEDPYNTPEQLKRIRRHLGLSSYAASAEEAKLGRELNWILLSIPTNGDRGTAIGLLCRGTWLLSLGSAVDDMETKGQTPKGGKNKMQYEEWKQRTGAYNPDDRQKWGDLTTLLSEQVSWDRWPLYQCWAVLFVFTAGVFWWMDWPPVTWLRNLYRRIQKGLGQVMM